MGFRINYSKVMSQASSIENNALELSTQIKLLEQIEKECNAVWKGEAANAFIAKLNILQSEMRTTQYQMQNLVGTIRYCANRIQCEDERAAERAANLRSCH